MSLVKIVSKFISFLQLAFQSTLNSFLEYVQVTLTFKQEVYFKDICRQYQILFLENNYVFCLQIAYDENVFAQERFHSATLIIIQITPVLLSFPPKSNHYTIFIWWCLSIQAKLQTKERSFVELHCSLPKNVLIRRRTDAMK